MALGAQGTGMRISMTINSSCERHGGVRRSLKTIIGPVGLVEELGFYLRVVGSHGRISNSDMTICIL